MRSNTNQVGQGMGTALTEEEKRKQEQEQAPQPQIQQTTSAAPRIGEAQATAMKAAPKEQKAGTGTFANLKSYIQAAQGGGQQRIAQAATQKVQNVATGAQKGIQQAQNVFGKKVEAGSLSGIAAPGGVEAVGKEAQDIINAARKVTYQAPQPATAPATQATAPATTAATAPSGEQPQQSVVEPTVAQAQQYFTPEQQKRFADIINAQYGGPASLQEAGLYSDIAKKARTAQEAIGQTQTAAGREQLLRNIFSQGRDYTRGQSKLDALLLNTSQQGVGELQSQAKQAGNIQQQAEQAQTQSANEAAQRAKEISDVQQASRKAFLEGRTAEEAATETRMDKLIKDPALDASGNKIPKLDMEGKPIVDAAGNPVYQTQWDQLPEYFRDIIRNKEANNKAMQAEAFANLDSSTGLNEAGYKKAQANLKAQQIALENAKNINMYRAIGGLAPDENVDEKIKIAQQNLDAAKSDLAGYSDYLKQRKDIQNMSMKQLRLSPEEAAILGVSSGEGFYNELPTLIKDVNAERSRLITKDEFARQQALAQLAGTDISRALQKDLMYTDAEKAGSQTLSSSLDTQAIRNALNEAQTKFKESAEAANLTGSGKKKVSRGNWAGTRTKTYTASQEGNVADMLRQAGYDVSAESPEAAKSLLTDKEALANYLGATDTSRGDSGSMWAEGAARTGTGAAIGAALGSYVPVIGTGVGAAIGSMYGSILGGNSTLSNVVGNLGGGRMSDSAMAEVGKGTAKELAIKDLYNKYNKYLAGQGFENRANIVDSDITSARSAALQDLLRRQG